ncbi:hypothetical protein BC936DRAFT_140655 [Jimgerdemannia flammicorona]|uniref:Uncharacterized protein n=1 Tax=Jimgerdemannia flammicorona TaxID=994334 RepID=A0A433DGR7_9FUNG|nr:hypothetical protein BC936DRAFT_140655 [Jimgerdemannia flammicorona]
MIGDSTRRTSMPPGRGLKRFSEAIYVRQIDFSISEMYNVHYERLPIFIQPDAYEGRENWIARRSQTR